VEHVEVATASTPSLFEVVTVRRRARRLHPVALLNAHARLNKARFVREDDGLRAVVQVELGEDAGEVAVTLQA
jgi:hypothetical protein